MNRAFVAACVVVAVLLAILVALWMRQMSREVDRFQELSELGVASLERTSRETRAILDWNEVLERRLSQLAGVAPSGQAIRAPKRRATLADVRRDWGIEGRLDCAAVTGDGGGRRALSGVP